jgi:hypothetical protein
VSSNFIEHGFRIFVNRVLRRIFRLTTKDVVGDWRREHNEELHNLYASQHITRVIRSRRMRWVGHEACMGEMRNAYKILVGSADGKGPLGRPRCRLGDNIRIYCREIW